MESGLMVPHPEVVLFDLGGVLFCDPWETLLLTPGTGLAARLGLPATAVSRAASKLFRSYSVRPAEEAQYWNDLGSALGKQFPMSLVHAAEQELLMPSPWAGQLIAEGASAATALGVVSDNTSFWYAKQCEILKIDEWAEPALVFLSHRLGVTKRGPGRGLYEIVAERVPAANVTIVDDGPWNLRRAGGLGMRAISYRYQRDGADMPDLHSIIGAPR
jgi:FMN phosphatase YigB (HAD superfamily)